LFGTGHTQIDEGKSGYKAGEKKDYRKGKRTLNVRHDTSQEQRSAPK